MNNPSQSQLAVILLVAVVLSVVSASQIPLAITIVVLTVTALFFLLWNQTVPGIFGVRQITFWEALRLLLMAWILFGGVFIRFAWR